MWATAFSGANAHGRRFLLFHLTTAVNKVSSHETTAFANPPPNRTVTDQVAGLGGGLKRSIGRSRMAGKVVEQFKELRKKISAR